MTPVTRSSRCRSVEAAVALLTGAAGKSVYELAGDRPFTMAELAAEVSRRAGKPIVYRDLPPYQYRPILTGAGLPGAAADLYVDADVLALSSSEPLRIGPPPCRCRPLS